MWEFTYVFPFFPTTQHGIGNYRFCQTPNLPIDWTTRYRNRKLLGNLEIVAAIFDRENEQYIRHVIGFFFQKPYQTVEVSSNYPKAFSWNWIQMISNLSKFFRYPCLSGTILSTNNVMSRWQNVLRLNWNVRKHWISLSS